MFSIAITVLTALWLWAMWCNLATYSQRQRLIAGWLTPGPDFYVRLEAWKAVSYERHLWLLLTFRKPVYPSPLGDE